MKELFDQISEECSKNVTKSYSTSFSLATKMLSSLIRQDIYNIYGFVRFADEIVDSFHNYNKEELFKRFVVIRMAFLFAYLFGCRQHPFMALGFPMMHRMLKF